MDRHYPSVATRLAVLWQVHEMIGLSAAASVAAPNDRALRLLI
jgi:hypothetical protein